MKVKDKIVAEVLRIKAESDVEAQRKRDALGECSGSPEEKAALAREIQAELVRPAEAFQRLTKRAIEEERARRWAKDDGGEDKEEDNGEDPESGPPGV